MHIIRHSSIDWTGDLRTGHGTIEAQSGLLHRVPFAYGSRFEGKEGSNPEELLAAAHAACYTMTLSMILGEAQLEAIELGTEAFVTLALDGSRYTISEVRLKVTGAVPGIRPEQFTDLAFEALHACPVSRVLRTDISIEATLED